MTTKIGDTENGIEADISFESNDLLDFIHIEPKLPHSDKNFIKSEPIIISVQ